MSDNENSTPVVFCKRPKGEKSTAEMFTSIAGSYFFVPPKKMKKRLNDGYSLVMPYIIVNDGRDVLCFINPMSTVDVGFTSLIYKDHGFKRRAAFLKSITRTVVEAAMTPLEGAQVVLTDDDGKTSFRDMCQEDFDIEIVKHAVISIDRRVIYPICLLNINKSFKVPESNEAAELVPVAISVLKRAFHQFAMPFISKAACYLIHTEEFTIPKPQGSYFECEV